MREIKFKVWVKKEKCICFVLELSFLNRYAIIQNDNIFGIGNSVKRDFKDFELMQYIGLEDKNDVSIYEGDLLKHNENIYKVIYDEVNFRILLLHIDNKDNWRELTWLNNVSKYIKIIGNKFEKFELLEVVK